MLTIKASAQTRVPVSRELPAVRLSGKIKLDGILSDSAWATAPTADKFVEQRPNPFVEESHSTRSTIHVLYDDDAIYLGGYLHESTKDSIQTELVGRDQIGANDFIGVVFDTYHDKINGFEFIITPLNEQFDAKTSNTLGEDPNWNAVWYSATKILNDGWTFEIKIPYSAIRFSKNNSVWGLNFFRRRRKLNQQLYWNTVDPTVNGFLNQSGTLTGLKNIKPPLRLSFSPYFSSYVNHFPANDKWTKNTTTSINGGMDVKYGIDQNYTLDMTVIPDFGQVQSDKNVLNLTPFEVQFTENRPFFTEGTELFSKGNLFYSRRIGGSPLHKYEMKDGLKESEIVTDNPSASKLINATKLSGRGKSGLGFGMLNAISKPMYATITDTITNVERTKKSGSLTNYNIFVVDKTLKNNSSVSLINLSTMRSGKDYDANVTGAIVDLNTKGNKYQFYGQSTLSNISSNGKSETGYYQIFYVAKNGGRFNALLQHELANSKYKINDLGYLQNSDFIDHYLYLGYKWIKPTKYFNNLYLNFNHRLSNRYSNGDYQFLRLRYNFNSQLKNLWIVGVQTRYNTKGNDFYEPHKDGYFYKSPTYFEISPFFESNFAKKYYFDGTISIGKTNFLNGRNYYLGWGQRYRFNNKFSIGTNFTFDQLNNNVGFLKIDDNDNIIFSKRLRKTSENTLTVKYSFTNKMDIKTILRHYWSQVSVKQKYNLQKEGTLLKNSTDTNNDDYNFNFFNVDMVYSWQIAAGSFLNIVWKNAIEHRDSYIKYKYFKNIQNTFDADQNNNFSIKILYYIDYLDIKKMRKKARP